MTAEELTAALTRLSPIEFNLMLAGMPAAAKQVSPSADIPTRAAQAVAWAESENGPGLEKLESMVRRHFPAIFS